MYFLTRVGTGTTGYCPSDTVLGSNVLCRNATGDCDQSEYCDGVNTNCPTDTYVPAELNQVCRAASDICDLPETCSGLSPTCPDDAYATSATLCRQSLGICDATEYCKCLQL